MGLASWSGLTFGNLSHWNFCIAAFVLWSPWEVFPIVRVGLEGLVPEHLAGLTQGLPVSLGDMETVLLRNAEPTFAPGKHELPPRSVTDIRCELTWHKLSVILSQQCSLQMPRSLRGKKRKAHFSWMKLMQIYTDFDATGIFGCFCLSGLV